ncbi:MAG: hypothetical protein U0W40_13300 [Acidimicrobiia bacterium]
MRTGKIVEVGPGLTPDGEEVLGVRRARHPRRLHRPAHLDPCAFFDPRATRGPQHGVTTAMVGNCSLSLFPVNDRQRRHRRRDPRSWRTSTEILTGSVPWTWTDCAGYQRAARRWTRPHFARSWATRRCASW